MSENKKKYRIAWKSLTTGYSGHGEWFDEYSYDELSEEVNKENVEWPDICHWIEDIDDK